MLKIFTFLSFLVLFCHVHTISAQSCLPNGIVFATQEQIDAFPANYPGCTTILGTVKIGSYGCNCDITSLNALSQVSSIIGGLTLFDAKVSNLNGLGNLTSIGGQLSINSNTLLSDISALANLTSVGSIAIGTNNNLSNLNGLSGITYVPGDVFISGNNITDIVGLGNISNIGGGLFISCSTLGSLNDLSGLNTLGGTLSIDACTAIYDLEGLEGLISVGGNLQITNNQYLFNLNGLTNLLSINGCIFIDSNNKLDNINGIKNITPSTIDYKGDFDPPGSDVMIMDNPMLAVCNVESVCNALLLPGKTYNIIGNATGCLEGVKDCIGEFCTAIISPVDGMSDIAVDSPIEWSSLSNVMGYRLSIGTTPGGSELVNNLDMGQLTSYLHDSDFPCGAYIYVRIVPYRNTGIANGCVEESFFTEDVLAFASSDTLICSGSSVLLNASGGTSYAWSPTDGLSDPGVPDPIANPSQTTIYTVTVSNDGRCPKTEELIVTVNPYVYVNPIAFDESGFEFNNGIAVANPAGGTAPYDYEWSNGKKFKTIAGLSPGVYTVTVTDKYGCTAVDSISIGKFLCPEIEIHASLSDNSCHNACDGAVEITGMDNAVFPVYYDWNTGDSISALVDLCAGTYILTASDTKNCTVTDSFVVSQPDLMEIEIDSLQNVSPDQKGFILVKSDTTDSYKYNWTGPEGFLSDEKDIYDLEAGCYNLTMENTMTDCKIDTTICLSFISNAGVLTNIEEVVVYPNPATSFIRVDFNNSDIVNAQIELLDLSAKSLFTSIKTAKHREVMIDIADMKSGIYVLRISHDKGVTHNKIVAIEP